MQRFKLLGSSAGFVRDAPVRPSSTQGVELFFPLFSESAVLARHVVLSGGTTFSSVCGSHGSRIVEECVFLSGLPQTMFFKVNMSTSGAPFRERPGIISYIMFTSGLHACHLCWRQMFPLWRKASCLMNLTPTSARIGTTMSCCQVARPCSNGSLNT